MKIEVTHSDDILNALCKEYSEALDYILHSDLIELQVKHEENYSLIFPDEITKQAFFPPENRIISKLIVSVPSFELDMVGTQINQQVPEVVYGDISWEFENYSDVKNKLAISMNTILKYYEQQHPFFNNIYSVPKFSVTLNEDVTLHNCKLIECKQCYIEKYFNSRKNSIEYHTRDEENKIISTEITHYKNKIVQGNDFIFQVEYITKKF